MAGGQRENHSARQIVLVVDARTTRREQLARRSGHSLAIEAASLSEAFPLAEEMVPDILAVSADFLVEPELEGLIRLADMLGSRIFLYSGDGAVPIQSPLRLRLRCVALKMGDGINDLIARVSDPRAHLSADPGEARPPDMILLGASTGGIAAIEAVLSAFSADCPPVLVVQHIRDDYVTGLVKRLNGRFRPRVVEASDGETLRRGTVYFAADASRHLTVVGEAVPRCALAPTPPRHGHRPAVDVLFESAVPSAAKIAAALLTGMGTDGAIGLGLLRRAGAFTIAQNRETSIVWGMPRAAVEAGAAEEVLAIDKIGPALLSGRGMKAAGVTGARSR